MSWQSFWIIFAITVGCNLLCRLTPMLALSGQRMGENITRALSYITTAAFAALVMSDLFNPAALSLGLWPFLRPAAAAIPVLLTARWTKSLGACILVGVGGYWLLTLL